MSHGRSEKGQKSVTYYLNGRQPPRLYLLTLWMTPLARRLMKFKMSLDITVNRSELTDVNRYPLQCVFNGTNNTENPLKKSVSYRIALFEKKLYRPSLSFSPSKYLLSVQLSRSQILFMILYRKMLDLYAFSNTFLMFRVPGICSPSPSG